jgi:hypothetical protein
MWNSHKVQYQVEFGYELNVSHAGDVDGKEGTEEGAENTIPEEV